MGLRRSKKKGKKEAPEARPKKRSEVLSSVLRESVASSSLALIRENDVFVISQNQGLAMAVYAEDIGGLDAHSAKNDEDKGQFLEQINNDSIHIFVDDKMLEEGKFLLIPDKDTLANLEEYGFISDPERFASFVPTIVTWNGNGDMTFIELAHSKRDYDWLVGVQNGTLNVETEFSELLGDDYMDDGEEDAPEDTDGGSVSDMMSGGVEPDENITDESDVPAEEDGDYLPIPEAADEDVADAVPESADDYTEDAADEPEIPQRGPVMPASGLLITCPVCGESCPEDGPCPACGWTPASEEAPEEDTVQEVDDTILMGAVSHVFYHGDLDLTVTAEPFDTQFLSKDRFVPINEDRGDGWLDGYVTQVIKNANHELLNLHRNNLMKTRDHFLQSMDVMCSTIADMVSPGVEGSPFYDNMQSVETAFEAKMKESSHEIERIQNEKQKRWDRERQQAIDSASAKASKEYDDRYARAHEAELNEVAVSVKNRIQSEREDNIRVINDLRRQEAQRLLNVHCAEALETAGKEYRELMGAEEDARRKILDTIQAYIDTHRSEEVSRISTLQRQIEYQQELKDTEAEMNRRLSEQSNQYEVMCDQLRQEIENAVANTKRICSEYDLKLADAEKRDSDNWSRINDLMTQCSTMEQQITERVSKDYEERIRVMEQSKAVTEQRLHDTKEANKQYNRVSVVVWVAISVMTLLIGLFVGSKWLSGAQSAPNYTLRLETDASTGVQDSAEDAVDDTVSGGDVVIGNGAE